MHKKFSPFFLDTIFFTTSAVGGSFKSGLYHERHRLGGI